MRFFRESFSRADTLESAGKALVSGDAKKAVSAYKKLLEVNPKDHATRAKMAGLLAASGEAKDAWLNYTVAANALGYLAFLWALDLHLRALGGGATGPTPLLPGALLAIGLIVGGREGG